MIGKGMTWNYNEQNEIDEGKETLNNTGNEAVANIKTLHEIVDHMWEKNQPTFKF